MRLKVTIAAAAALISIGLAACGGSSGSSSTAVNPNAAEVSPAGDIPDNQVFIAYSPPGGGVSVKVPEGWSRSSAGGATTFTDKLNSVKIETGSANAPLTIGAANASTVPSLARSVQGFSNPQVSTVQRNAGTALLIKYLAQGKPDPVTGKSSTDAVERYSFFSNGRQLILTLSGPQGADNVDPWQIITDSVRWTG